MFTTLIIERTTILKDGKKKKKILTEITQHGNRSALPFWKFVKAIEQEALNQQLTVQNLKNGQQVGSRSTTRVTKEKNISRMRMLYSGQNKLINGVPSPEITAKQYVVGLINNY